MTDLTPDDLARIEELAEKAWQFRPWKAVERPEWGEWQVSFEDSTTDGPIEVPLTEANATLMAESVTMFPALVAAVRSGDERITELETRAKAAERDRDNYALAIKALAEMDDEAPLERLSLYAFMDHNSGLPDAVARVKAAAWWAGVSAQWQHRPIGNRLPETSNPHRKDIS